jgi:hypothetical protein
MNRALDAFLQGMIIGEITSVFTLMVAAIVSPADIISFQLITCPK